MRTQIGELALKTSFMNGQTLCCLLVVFVGVVISILILTFRGLVMNKLFLNYTVRLGLFGSTNEPNEIVTTINEIMAETQWRYIEYITGSLGYVANVLTEYDFEPEKEYDRCIIFWDGSEECNKVIQHCKQNDIPYWIRNKEKS